jgi:hypothetical protein
MPAIRSKGRFCASEDESLTPLSEPPFWRAGVLSGFISKSLFKINLADGTLFENTSTHLFRIKEPEQSQVAGSDSVHLQIDPSSATQLSS